jgi:hypothetical protein
MKRETYIISKTSLAEAIAGDGDMPAYILGKKVRLKVN